MIIKTCLNDNKCTRQFYLQQEEPIKGCLLALRMVEGKRFNHPGLIAEKRSRMKIMLFDPNQDLPIKTITAILQQAINLYKRGEIKVKSK